MTGAQENFRREGVRKIFQTQVASTCLLQAVHDRTKVPADLGDVSVAHAQQQQHRGQQGGHQVEQRRGEVEEQPGEEHDGGADSQGGGGGEASQDLKREGDGGRGGEEA